LQCVQKNQPSVELCDGKDNDCNGAVDQGNPGGGQSCDTGQQGICQAGTTMCSAGALQCVPNVPTPQPEVCNGLDDNCNGTADENNPQGGQVCDTGKLGVCQPGTTNCNAGQLACVQNVTATGEVCDNKDNDCNGTIDDSGAVNNIPCQTGLQGVCSAGLSQCVAGSPQCNQLTQPSAEKCNLLDDNCDGTSDNGNPNSMCNLQYPSAGNVATWACNSGACEITACQAGFKNTNGSPADGCEATTCVTNPSPSTCGGPTASPGLTSLAPTFSQTGQLTVDQQEVWFAPTFSAPNPSNGPPFQPTIQLTLNQGGDYQLDVFYGCAGSYATCPGAGAHTGGGNGQNVSDKWQMNFNANPSACGSSGVGACTNLSSVPTNIRVRVKRIKVTDPCNQFTVNFTQ
jgi:hypothetical protein